MSTSTLIANLFTYTVALWLGAFLMARDLRAAHLRYAGAGLLTYAFALAGAVLLAFAPDPEAAEHLARFGRPLLFLPALLWSGGLTFLLAEQGIPLPRSVGRWQHVFLPFACLLYLLGLFTPWFFSPDDLSFVARSGIGYWIAALLALTPLLILLSALGHWLHTRGTRKQAGLMLVAVIFFALSSGFLIVPLAWLPRTWIVLAMGFDLLLLGVATAWLDAFDAGEALVPDMLRSFYAAMMGALLFGGTVGLTMAMEDGPTFPMVVLLLAIVGLVVISQAFRHPLEQLVDRFAFARYPLVRETQEVLRTESQVQTRRDRSLDPTHADPNEFARLTRRALSHYGNLPKLAANPLTRLPLVDQRLDQREGSDSALTRAAILKQLLTESIHRLRPTTDSNGSGATGFAFSSTDEWRHFNALYYPYVIGLKPYSRRLTDDNLDETYRAALDWFRTYVPQRTLYNWQNAAAKLVAEDLQEQMKAAA